MAHLAKGAATVGESGSMFGSLPTNSGTAITVGPADNIWAVIKTVLNETNSNIISQPFGIVSNRKQYTYNSGERRGYLGSYQGSQGLRSYEYLNADNVVEITPSINKNGIIDLIIHIDFSDFTAPNKTGDSKATRTTRKIETRVSMAAGEVLILGGLGRSRLTETHYRTPFLSRIPIIGNLFKNRKKDSDKQHLYFFIRPSLIKPEFHSATDDYTQFKIDYAKHQIFNFQKRSDLSDPIQQFFFKPRNTSSRQARDNIKNKRFSWIDNFTERKHQPRSVDMKNDEYYQSKQKVFEQLRAKKEQKGWSLSA
jgi:type II secretory pathway component GspD/PulD (secretin)